MDNRVQSALERGGLVDITTRGRITGRPRRIEIAFHNIDGRLYISGMASRRKRKWLGNLEADPHFVFHLKRQVQADIPARARVITDEAERRQILTQVARVWRARDVETMVRYSPLIEVTLETLAA